MATSSEIRHVEKQHLGEDDFHTLRSTLEHVTEQFLHGGGADRLLEVDLLDAAGGRRLQSEVHK